MDHLRNTQDARRVPRFGARWQTHQRGVALIIGLVLLVVLALLGASAYSVATQDERMAGNARDHARAMDAAESMLRACEDYVKNTPSVFDISANGMLQTPVPGQTWAGENPSTNWSGTAPGANVAIAAQWTDVANGKPMGKDWSQSPQCIVEHFTVKNPYSGNPNTNINYQVAHISARGYGANKNNQVTLVSYVAYSY